MADGPFEPLWSRRLHLRSSAVVVAPGSVRLDAITGEPQWEQRVEDCWGTPVVSGDHCLCLSRRGVLHCLDTVTGRPLWSRLGLEFRRYVTVLGSALFTGGVQVLWRHTRDIHPVPPLLDERTLRFADEAGLTVVDLDRGAVIAELPLPHRVVSTAMLQADRALFALANGSVLVTDRTGDTTSVPVLPRIDLLLAGDDGLIHVSGNGQLATLRTSPPRIRPGSD
jgi:hypothetical protein